MQTKACLPKKAAIAAWCPPCRCLAAAFVTFCAVAGLLVLPLPTAWGGESAAGWPVRLLTYNEPVPIPTLGGSQLWADELLYHDWRIQRNCLTGHYRLLDGANRRHASGSFASCHLALGEIRRRQDTPPMTGEVVILVHGLFNTRSSMRLLGAYLERHGAMTVLYFEYPSTRGGIEDHAASLARVVEHLDEAEGIHFVGHSMGNLVVRYYLARADGNAEGPGLDPRIGRFLMIAPPNHGADAADLFADWRLARRVAGKSLDQLGPHWPWLEAALGTPPRSFAIIAGGLDNRTGFNPLIAGDDDGLVSIDDAYLPGAEDFVVVPATHSMLLVDRRVMAHAVHFLRYGRFAE